MLAEAASKKLASGAAVEAIHLAEIALNANPRHVGASSASLAAHRALLEQTHNFWETRWLEKEIAKLQEIVNPKR